MRPDRPNPFTRWLRFVRERFPLAVYVPLTALFVVGNAGAVRLVGGTPFSGWRVAVACVAVLLVFLRLRITDELKDLDEDRTVHPERPLARGLVSVSEVRRMTGVLAAGEGGLALACGLTAVLAWFLVLGYSLLMAREFGIRQFLRKRPVVYAFSHTLIAGLLGVFVATAVLGKHLWRLSPGICTFVFANWALFNVFELARKTCGAEELTGEKAVYLRAIGPRGLAALISSQVLIAVLIGAQVLHAAGRSDVAFRAAAFCVGCTLVVVCLYAWRPHRMAARLVRGVMGLFLVAYYLLFGALAFG